MIGTEDLAADVISLGELLGLLTPTGDGATVDKRWLEHPLASVGTMPGRLHYLVSIVDSILGPGLSNPPPDAVPGAVWYPIPDPTTGGPTPFCLVTSPPSESAGQLGLGFVCPTQLGALTLQAFAYVPLLTYDPDGDGSGATFITDSPDNPSKIGLAATTSGTFSVQDGSSTVTFTAMTMAADIYLTDKAPGFTLTFDGLTGTSKKGTFTSLRDLLDPDVESWIAEVMLQGQDWLNVCIGGSDVTIGEALVAAHFLTKDKTTGAYSLSLSNLQGQDPLDIALNFVFAALDALSTLQVPLLPLPGGGVFIASRPTTGDYGIRLMADLQLTSPTTHEGKTPPSFDLSLGTWFTGDTATDNWMTRADGPAAEPGLSVFVLNRDPTNPDHALTFTPSLELVSVGLTVTGSSDAPLVDLDGYTLQGAELRAYFNSHDSDFGVAARIDSVGFPLGPGFSDTQGAGAKGNPVASSLIASDDATAADKQTDPVNPAFSAELAHVKDKPPSFTLLDPSGVATDLIWIPVQRRFGPLNIQKMGLRVDVTGKNATDPVLGVIVDGGVQLSVLDVELDDLSIDVHLNQVSHIGGYEIDLQGLSVAFNSGTVDISGGLMKSVDPTTNLVSYDGDALIKIADYAIAAIGSYTSLPKGGGTSLFIFATLDAPLGGPPFCFVTGVALGFGYNRGLKLPAQGEVASFPLVAAMEDSGALGGPNASPADVLAKLGDWVPPERGEYWIAAGVQFTTFEVINTNALLVIEFGQELTIAVLGVATLRQPLEGDPYVFAELDIDVIYSPGQGEFKASAVLADSSYVMTPQAHLTGGFAAYGWFGGSVHAGDFVFTIGGYHPAFNKPAWYPDEPRVGINWQVSSALSLVGTAYLAVVPTAMMAGAALQITYEDGPLKAWLSAQADAICYFRPFYVLAGASVSVGISYRVDVLFVHKTLSVEIGAGLQIWGPPVSGTVHVDWYIISFTIGFGPDSAPNPPSTIGWSEFTAILPSKTTQSAAPTAALAAPTLAPAAETATTTKTPAYLTINAVAGLLRTSTSTSDSLTHWLVRPSQVAFAVGSAVPASSIVIESNPASGDLSFDGTKVGIRRVNGDISPSAFLSTQTVTILALTSDSADHLKACLATSSPCTGQPVGCGDSPVDISTWDVATVQTQVPEALWGAPVAGSAPDINSSTPTIAATTGATLTPKASAPTNGTPSMVIDTIFDDRTVNPDDEYCLPLSQSQQPSQNSPQPSDSLEDLTHINDATVVARRNAMFAALQGLGINGWTNGDLQLLAADPGQAFADPPLERATAGVS